MPLLAEDAAAVLHGPIYDQAVAEFPAAFAELRERLGIAPDAVVGLVGGSMGSAVAAGVLAAGTSGAKAAVLVSPMLQLRTMIDAVAPMFGGYTWSPRPPSRGSDGLRRPCRPRWWRRQPTCASCSVSTTRTA